MKGSGKLGKSEGSVSGTEPADAANDAFHYVYKTLNGDGEIVAKLADVTAIDNHALNALMIRDTNSSSANTVVLAMSSRIPN